MSLINLSLSLSVSVCIFFLSLCFYMCLFFLTMFLCFPILFQAAVVGLRQLNERTLMGGWVLDWDNRWRRWTRGSLMSARWWCRMGRRVLDWDTVVALLAGREAAGWARMGGRVLDWHCWMEDRWMSERWRESAELKIRWCCWMSACCRCMTGGRVLDWDTGRDTAGWETAGWAHAGRAGQAFLVSNTPTMISSTTCPPSVRHHPVYV